MRHRLSQLLEELLRRIREHRAAERGREILGVAQYGHDVAMSRYGPVVLAVWFEQACHRLIRTQRAERVVRHPLGVDLGIEQIDSHGAPTLSGQFTMRRRRGVGSSTTGAWTATFGFVAITATRSTFGIMMSGSICTSMTTGPGAVNSVASSWLLPSMRIVVAPRPRAIEQMSSGPVE